MGQDSYDLAPLIVRAKAGDEKAFIDLLVDCNYEQVIRTVAREYASQIPGYSEDRLFQELVVYIWQAVRHDTFNRFDRWLRRITRDNCRFIRFKARFINGDGDAFQPYESLVRNQIRNKFHKITRSGYEDDVVQDVQVRICERLPEFRKNADAFKYFLYKTTRGCCHKIIDKLITPASLCKPLEPDDTHTPGEMLDPVSFEKRQRVRQAIWSLPEEYRKPVILKECLELRHREISEILDISTGASRTRVKRGKSRLKTALK